MSRPDPRWPRAGVWLASESSEPDLVVVGVPSSQGSLFSSSADLAPGAVRDRLDRFSTFHGEMGVDFEAVAVRDMGNWPVSQLDMFALIQETMTLAKRLPEAPLQLFIGGDNAITRPLVASRSEDLTSVGVITFDAHHDVRTLENGPNNGTPMRGLIEEHGLPGGNIVQIGIHSFANSAPYRRYCDEAGVTVVTVEEVERMGMPQVVDQALKRLESCSQIYVDVDVDVLDIAFAPACPGARPGGLDVRQLAGGVARAAADPLVTAMDFVEVDPTRDVDHRTLDVMAHLILTAVTGLATRLRT